MNGPSPHAKHPMEGFPQACFVKNTLNNPNIIVGDYTYYDDPEESANFERKVLYHYPFIGDKFIIGKFCALARGIRFIMNGANHKLSGVSTYPLQIFGNGWEKVAPAAGDLPYKGDTVIGHDVWIGYEALIMPGVNIGKGAIVAARAVVTRDVPAYTVVAGNPAKPLRSRFSPAVIARLQAVAWWAWPIGKVNLYLPLIVSGNIETLCAAGPTKPDC